METSVLKLDTDRGDIRHDTTELESLFFGQLLRPCTKRGKKRGGLTLFSTNCSRKELKLTMVLSLTVVLSLAGVVLYFYVQKNLYGHAAVVTNASLCANVGVNIMKKNGSAVEAAIATMICEGVLNFESMGIGGGFVMTIYKHQTKSATSLIAKQTAPLKPNINMSPNTTDKSFLAVPGELMGYGKAFHKYASGNIKWADLFQPSIDLCVYGFEVTPHLATLLEQLKEIIQKTPSLSEILINPDTNTTWLAGDILKRPKLGTTLKKIATEGVQSFYNGSVGDDFIADLKDFGSLMTKKDLKNYQVQWEDTVSCPFSDGITLYTSPRLSSGPVLTFILNILDSFVTVSDETKRYQRMIEAFKFAIGHWTLLGDPCFESFVPELLKNITSREFAVNIRARIKDNETSNDPRYYGAQNLRSEDKGTANICVLAPNGDAVVVTSSVNEFLGAKLRSVRTGIILNYHTQNYQFSVVKDKDCDSFHSTNFVIPRTIPLSSISHSFFVDHQENVRLILGSTGGTKIIPIVAQVAIANLWLNYTLRDAIKMPKIYLQLYPMQIHYHSGINQTVLDNLKAIGHNMKQVNADDGSITTGIAVQRGRIYAHSDCREGGESSGF